VDDAILIDLTADIVAAQVSNNAVSANDIAGLISAVYGALSKAGDAAVTPAAALVPAVPVRSSVKPDRIVCLDCGRKFRTIKRHLSSHGLTPDAYRARWNLAADYPVVAPDYAAKRSQLALSVGLGRKSQAITVADPAREPVAVTTARPVRKRAKKVVRGSGES